MAARSLHHFTRLAPITQSPPSSRNVRLRLLSRLQASGGLRAREMRQMRGHLQSSSRHNAISICVALGAGALLCARAYSRSTSGTRSSSSSSSSQSSEALAVASSKKSGVPDSESRLGDVNPDTADAPAKQPCSGCDCGLMEPGPIEGTMHAYERHIIICSGHEDWPKVVEAEESSLAESLFNLCLGAGLIFTKKVALAAKKAGAPKTRQVKISACSEPSRGPEGTTDVIVYPEGLIYSLSRDDTSSLEHFLNVQLLDGQVASKLQPVPVPYKKMVLVCTHMSRDKRCGRAGPQVIGEMRKSLEARGVGPDEIAVRGSSHFGGHKYAGVLIIYPQGDWFGLVSKKNAGAIVDKCVLGTEGMKSNWRGNMSNPGTKAEPPAEKPKPPASAAAASASPAPVPTPAPATPKQEPESSGSAAVSGVLAGRPRRESIDGA